MAKKMLLLALLLLLITVGMVAAQSSTNFIVQRFVLAGGGSAQSANYGVSSVIGQPATDTASSPNFKVSAGFLYPIGQSPAYGRKIWLPVIVR